MEQQDKREGRAQDPAEGRNDIPPPEKGSPGGDESAVSDEAAEHVEKGKDKDANPLAPPINIQGGS